jgi:hypothetical protein
VFPWTPFPPAYGNRRKVRRGGKWKDVIVRGPVWQEQADEQQEEAEEEQLSYQNSYWKVDDQVLPRDRKGIYR